MIRHSSTIARYVACVPWMCVKKESFKPLTKINPEGGSKEA